MFSMLRSPQFSFVVLVDLRRTFLSPETIRTVCDYNKSNRDTMADVNHPTVIKEGQAVIETAGKVFCNPVQEFNRDLSISVLRAFARIYAKEKDQTSKIRDTLQINLTREDYPFLKGIKYETGLCILEALSATGLRSIRYAKEVPGILKIIANDISKHAVEDMKRNIWKNGVEELVFPSLHDAMMLMYEHKKHQFDAIDLDPYGCPSIFLDSAVQAIKDGGLLLVTATDMAVLAGNAPETCYTKYGAISLRMKACHEMALRILLQCIESFANRYGRYIVPQLSISADFYIRVFVRVYSGPVKCKFTTSKLSMVYHCTGCDSFQLQPLGKVKISDKTSQVKFCLPTSPFASTLCDHCGNPYHLGGPIWSAPIHNPEFVKLVLDHATEELTTFKRIEGILNMVLEELIDTPLYYTLERLSGTIHVETPPMLLMRSAILNAGYQVSYTHCNKTSIKTNAPAGVLWDIMKTWVQTHPVNEKWLSKDTVTGNILSKPCKQNYSLEMHADANPESRKMGFKRFQINPTAFWGPGSRAMAMIGEEKITKSIENQGKRKRSFSGEGYEDGREEEMTENPGQDLKNMQK